MAKAYALLKVLEDLVPCLRSSLFTLLVLLSDE